MNATELLIKHSAERRVYETAYEYFDHLSPSLNDWKAWWPESSSQIDGCFQLLRKPTRKNPTARFSIQDVVITGRSDLTPIETQLGIDLPDFFCEFYHQIRGAALALLSPVVICDVAQMLDLATVYQQVDVENGFPAKPTSILRFASIPPLPVCFAIRRRTTDGDWRVVCVADESTREDILNESFWPEESQETMVQWMARLLDTDGNPLAVDRAYPPLWRSDIRRVDPAPP